MKMSTESATMQAVYYHQVDIDALIPFTLTRLTTCILQPREFEIKDVPIPQISDDEVLLKGL